MKACACLFSLMTLVAAVKAASVDKYLEPKWPSTVVPTNFLAGNGKDNMAVNQKWALLGVPHATTKGFTVGGAVQVFSSTTAAWSRRLEPPASALAAGLEFGHACALSGDLAFIGAPNGLSLSNAPGKVFIYNLTTGALVKTLTSLDSAIDDRFGYSLALGNGVLAVGGTTANSANGRVWIFKLSDWTRVATLDNPESGGKYGFSCSIEGNLLLVSAPDANSSQGAAYLYNISQFPSALLTKLQPGLAGEKCGRHALLHQGEAYLSCGNVGKIYRVDFRRSVTRTLTASTSATLGNSIAVSNGVLAASTNSGIFVFNLSSASNTQEYIIPLPADGTIDFGGAVGMYRNLIVVSDSGESAQAPSAGRGYLVKDARRNSPFTTVANKGEVAPLTTNSFINGFPEAVLNRAAVPGLITSLNGSGSNGGLDRAMWETFSSSLTMGLKSRYLFGGVTIGSTVQKVLANDTFNMVVEASIAGAPTATNRAIFRRNNTGSTTMDVRKGENLGATGYFPTTFGQTSQSRSEDRYAFLTKFKSSTAAPVVNSTSDSCLVWRNFSDGFNVRRMQEGTYPANLGELASHFAYFDNNIIFSAGVQGVPTSMNAALYRTTDYQPLATSMIVQKGNGIYDGVGNTSSTHFYSTFLSESVDDAEVCYVRGTYTGPGGTKEAMWKFGPTVSTFRMVQFPDNLIAGIGYRSRLNGFWASYTQCILWYNFKGPGITTANDGAVILLQTSTGVSGNELVLLREGQPAPGCHPAKIGTIQRVEVDPYYGHYYIIATLTGAPAGTELVMYRGYSSQPLNSGKEVQEQIYRQPFPVLRKGAWFNGETRSLASFTFPVKNRLAGGGGSVGLGKAMQEPLFGPNQPSSILPQLTFGTTTVRLVKGVP